LASLPGWELRPLSAASAAQRLALRELAFLPLSFASAPGAALAASRESPLYAFEDEGDHFKACARLSGLDGRAAAGLALGLAEQTGAAVEASGGPRFARDPGLGWICSTVEELGEGLVVAALVHLPALVMAGLQDRLFRALMAEGIQVRGAYAEEGASVGALFGLAATGSAGGSATEIADALENAARSAVAAERRAREEVARREPEALLDAAGRALGILSNARRISREEAANLLSSLRLASLSGMLRVEGEGPRDIAGRLGTLLGLAGPGCAAAFEGHIEPVTEAERACFLRRGVAGLSLLEEDRCSRA
jgi:protein arginine kinase